MTQTQIGGTTGTWQHFFDNFIGKPGTTTNAHQEQGQAMSGANTIIPFHFPTASSRTSSSCSPPSRRCCSSGACSVGSVQRLVHPGLVLVDLRLLRDAFMLWGGGYFAQEGALDFSGGYVIHMSAGISGFVAAWVLTETLR